MIHLSSIQIFGICFSQHVSIYLSRVRALRTNKFDRTMAEQWPNIGLIMIYLVLDQCFPMRQIQTLMMT